MDFMILPELLFRNVSSLPVQFIQEYPYSYHYQNIDLNMQLLGSLNVILNRRIQNPHLRVEFLKFGLYITPRKNVNPRNILENDLYKTAFFDNEACRNYLMHAVIIVYIDSEKTDYYGKF